MLETFTRRTLLPLLLVSAAAYARSAVGQQPPLETSSTPSENIHGSVTLPYAELRALWLAGQNHPAPPPDKPPVTYALRSAHYDFEFAADPQEGIAEASFDVLTFGEEWTAVPLLGSAGARLQGIEPEGTLVAVRDGFYTLLTNKPGTHPTKLRFTSPLTARDGTDGKRRLDLRLETGPSVINELVISKLPAGWIAEVPGGIPAAPREEGAPLRFSLPSEGRVAMTLARAEDKRPAAAPAQSVWRGEAQSVVRYDDGRLTYETHLRITTEAGAGLAAAFLLPISVNVSSVSSDDLQQWHATRADDAGGNTARRLELTWKTPDVLRREIVLKYERPQLLPSGDWQLVSPGLAVGQGRLESALYTLPAAEGLEFTSSDASSPLSPGNARQLSHWLADEIGNANFLLFSTNKPAPEGNETSLILAKPLPLVQTAKATVETSDFDTRLVADGASLSKGTWVVRHDAPMTFTLTLPARAQVLTCQADNHDAVAVDRGSGKMEISLPASAPGKPTTVAVSYTDKQGPLVPVSGQVTLGLPQTPLLVKSLHWDLQIPDAYELIALEGNVSQVLAGSGTRSDNVSAGIHLSKELLNGEQPSVELFYQKRSVNP